MGGRPPHETRRGGQAAGFLHVAHDSRFVVAVF